MLRLFEVCSENFDTGSAGRKSSLFFSPLVWWKIEPLNPHLFMSCVSLILISDTFNSN